MIELPHCDINLVTHCSARCVSCSHASPFAEPWSMTPEMLERDLASVKPILKLAKLQMVGGEPTLHRDIVTMLRIARASGVSREVSVITNGKHLRRMPDDFWRELDYLQLSIYPTLDPAIPPFAKAKCAEFGKPFYETTFTHFHAQFRATPNDGSHFNTCHWRRDCYGIHDGHFSLCPQSLFFPKSFMGLDAFVDSLPLAGITEEKLSAFLNRKEPLNACRICCANEMKPKPWAEAKNKDEWLAGSILR